MKTTAVMSNKLCESSALAQLPNLSESARLWWININLENNILIGSVINYFSDGDEGYFLILFQQVLVEQRGHEVWLHFSSLKTWVNHLWVQNLSLWHLNKSFSPIKAIVSKSQALIDPHLTFTTLDQRISILNLNVKYLFF